VHISDIQSVNPCVFQNDMGDIPNETLQNDSHMRTSLFGIPIAQLMNTYTLVDWEIQLDLKAIMK